MKETYFLEAWTLGSGKLTWTERDQMPIKQWHEWFDYHEAFVGDAAIVHVGFSDYELTRSDALEIATRFMKGEYNLTTVYLDRLESVTQKGINHIMNPRQ